MSKQNPVLPCPTCEKPHTYDMTSPFRPFCSERCKLIDLGEWASETRKIAGEPNWDAMIESERTFNEH